jgi:hypothetical protein
MRRPWAILVALVLLAAACGGDDNTPASAPSTTTTVASSPGPTTANGQPKPPPTASSIVGPVTTAAPDEVPTASHDASGPPGSAAPLYLRPQPASTLVIEVSAEDGAAPEQSAIAHVATVLGRESKKSIETASGRVPPAHAKWTANDVRSAADAVAVTPQQGDVAVIRLLYVHGQWADDDSVLGISVRGDVAAIFSDAVASSADPITGAGAIQAAVTTHEVGHLLGLVDLYMDTGRGDPQHPGHSTDRNSVMYWAVESTLVTDLLTGGPPSDFDAADRADLAKIRGGA